MFRVIIFDRKKHAGIKNSLAFCHQRGIFLSLDH